MVFAKWPTGHECQVWTDEEGSKLYIYDMAQWLEYTPWVSNEGKTYWPTWKAIDGDDEVGFYDTNEPTDLYTWESGDEATYIFKDWDGTILKTGKVDEGTAPTPPADPTRAATAQYTYTFAGWNPTVWPITKKTTYTATYTSTVNQYTITFVDEDGTTELDEQTLDYGATPVYAGETPTKEATAQYTYTFSWWTPEIATVTWNATYTATYSSTVNQYTITATSSDTSLWTVSPASVANVEYGTALTVANNVITVGTWASAPTITATAEEWNTFTGWLDWRTGLLIPSTVTGDITVEAEFSSSAPENATLYLSNSDMELAIYVDDSVEAVENFDLPVTTDTVFYVDNNVLYIGSVNDDEPIHTITVDWQDAESEFDGWILGTPNWDITPTNNTDYVVWDVMTASNEVLLYCVYI